MEKKHRHHLNRHPHHSHHHQKKKKLSWFYKVSFSLLLIAFIALFYFVVLVSSEPKSISFVTEQIQKKLEKSFGDDVALENSYVSFTRYGTLKIGVTSLKILYTAPGKSDKQALIIPRFEEEFSLLNFLFFNFQPTKIKLIKANIIIDNLQELQLSEEKKIADSEDQLSIVMKLLSSIRRGDNPIKNIEIEDAKLLIRGQNLEKEILLKSSKIHALVKNKKLNITSQNQLSFDGGITDVNLTSSCQLSKHDGLKCDLLLKNFSLQTVASLHPSLTEISKVSGLLDANISFLVKNAEFSNILFKARSDKGFFDFSEFFGHPISFANLTIAGEYNHKMKLLDLSAIETDLESDLGQQGVVKPHLSMSVVFSGFGTAQKKSDFYISLQNVLNDELEKFWPVALQANDVRNWVITHIKGGVIKSAYAKFSLDHGDLPDGAVQTTLKNINSTVVFSDFNLSYSPDFPRISQASGIANFTQSGMKINIVSGNILNSKISDALVAIDDFGANNLILKISGKAQGHPADGLKHADNRPEFFTEIEKYLNGDSRSEFDIRVPLYEEITLKNSYIAVNSIVSQLNNGYLSGGVVIKTKKDFNSVSFVTNIDLTAAEMTAPAFNVKKKLQSESGLDFILVVKDSHHLQIKNIILSKKEADGKIGKVSGEIDVKTAPFAVTRINLQNENFGKNNYNLFYFDDEKSAAKKIIINGSEIDLASLLEQKIFPSFSESGNSSSLQIQASIARINLLKNKFLRNFSMSLNCKNGLCVNGAIKGNYGKKQSINFLVDRQAKKDFSTIEGRISDVGYLAEALGISNVIANGDAKIKLQNKLVKNRPLLEGKINIDNSITIYESQTVKRLAKDNLFSKVRDAIFSSEKTIFDSVKIEFDIGDQILNLHSLIANNYKIGITSKGTVDLRNNSYQFKGMIIPGFLINNLFGIGNLPILGNLLTGGEGGGVFGLRYEYIKTKDQAEASFTTNKIASFVPSTIQNLFDF